MGLQKWRGAFTLLEVLFTVFVLGVISLGLFSAFTAGLGMVRSARENLRAT